MSDFLKDKDLKKKNTSKSWVEDDDKVVESNNDNKTTPNTSTSNNNTLKEENKEENKEEKKEEKNEKKEIDEKLEEETNNLAKLAISAREEHYHQRLRVIQNDPSSHLSSAKTFQELNLPQRLLNGIITERGLHFSKPSKIQEVALPFILATPPQNLVAQAQSGSGKTVAFVLGMLNRIDLNLNQPQALCLTPTRELANQIVEDVLLKMSIDMEGLRIRLGIAGERIAKGEHITDHIIVGTPGKILDWISKSRVLNTKHIKIFVLDEADDMVAEGGHRIKTLKIKKKMPKTCQKLFFSATYSEEIYNYAKNMVENPNTIKLASNEELVLDVITQLWVDTREHSNGKLGLLEDLYSLLEMEQSIIFVQTKKEADAVTKKMIDEGFDVSTLHGNLENAERDERMQEFRAGTKKVLITTNVLARGVDIPGVSCVVNYDLPVTRAGNPDYETYLHRIGRTGRFGRKGTAINFIANENDIAVLAQIEQYFMSGGEMIKKAPGNDVETLEKMVNRELDEDEN